MRFFVFLFLLAQTIFATIIFALLVMDALHGFKDIPWDGSYLQMLLSIMAGGVFFLAGIVIDICVLVWWPRLRNEV